MGTYTFQRSDDTSASPDAGDSLQSDVITALREIDWVESFTLHADSSNETVSVDIVFDEQWPDIRTANPDQVSEVFDRLGLRTVANPSLSNSKLSADDPLSVQEASGGDLGTDLFEMGE
ncbi:MAG: hypothetical protein ABIW30_01565 [Arenimonas sp.]